MRIYKLNYINRQILKFHNVFQSCKTNERHMCILTEPNLKGEEILKYPFHFIFSLKITLGKYIPQLSMYNSDGPILFFRVLRGGEILKFCNLLNKKRYSINIHGHIFSYIYSLDTLVLDALKNGGYGPKRLVFRSQDTENLRIFFNKVLNK